MSKMPHAFKINVRSSDDIFSICGISLIPGFLVGIFGFLPRINLCFFKTAIGKGVMVRGIYLTLAMVVHARAATIWILRADGIEVLTQRRMFDRGGEVINIMELSVAADFDVSWPWQCNPPFWKTPVLPWQAAKNTPMARTLAGGNEQSTSPQDPIYRTEQFFRLALIEMSTNMPTVR